LVAAFGLASIDFVDCWHPAECQSQPVVLANLDWQQFVLDWLRLENKAEAIVSVAIGVHWDG